jgi:NAD dependent epimerase/dehydratase
VTLRGKRVLVTGAGGFIGSHLVERLIEAGASVRALVRYRSSGSAGWLDASPHRREIDILRGNVEDRDSVMSAARGVDVVFHLAALIGIPYSYESPASYVRTNVEGTLNVLQAAREENVGLVVHTSTSEVYGSAIRCPISEDHPLQGQSPYSATKIAADKLAEAFHLSFELPVVTVRPFNTYGPRQSTRAVIPTVISQVLGKRGVRLGSLQPTRDFTFVTDTVEGFVKAAEGAVAIGHVINLGTGTEISIGDLAQRIMEIIGYQVPIELDAERVRPSGSEVQRLCSDNTRARQWLEWEPRVSLDEGLARTVAWVTDNLGSSDRERYSV